MRKRKIFLALLWAVMAIGAFALTWFIVHKQMGYPSDIGLIVGCISSISVAAFFIGLLYPVKVMATLAGGSALTLGYPWYTDCTLTTGQRLAWTAAMVAVPLATFFLGRAISRRFQVKQIVSD